jgi:hypothetical protein
MAGTRTIAPVTLTAGTPTPVYTGAVTAAVSFSIKNNVATIVLNAAAFPAVGYNPGGYPMSGAHQGRRAAGDQVTLWGFTTATYFNGKTVSVVWNDPANLSFSFNFTNADVNSTNDAGKTAIAPAQQYRSVRLEVDSAAAAGIVYVGDLNVASTRYAAALSLSTQIAYVAQSGAIPADRLMLDTSATGTKVQVSLMY